MSKRNFDIAALVAFWLFCTGEAFAYQLLPLIPTYPMWRITKTIDWYYNAGQQPSDLDKAQVIGIVQDAAAAWSKACGVTINYKGETTSMLGTGMGTVLVQFATTGSSGIILPEDAPTDATAVASYNNPHGFILFTPDNKRVTGWTLNELLNVSMHEWGHILGIGHNQSLSSAVMFPRENGVTALDADDIEACKAIYQAPGPGEFSFAPSVADVPGEWVTSQRVIVDRMYGFPILVKNGEYALLQTEPVFMGNTPLNSLYSSGWTAQQTTISEWERGVVLRVKAPFFGETATASLTIGGVTRDFVVSTRPAQPASTFTIPPIRDVMPGTEQISSAVTVAGLSSAATSISITNGEYAIAPYTTDWKTGSGKVSNGDVVYVRLTASNSYGDQNSAILNIGGTTGKFVVSSVALDTTVMPDPFAFTAKTEVPLSTISTASVTVSGLTKPAAISIANGEYQLLRTFSGTSVGKLEDWTTAPTVVSNGDVVYVRNVSSSSSNTTVSTILTIGGRSASFETTTVKSDADGFSIASKTTSLLDANVYSDTIVVHGPSINVKVPISIIGGAYSVGGEYTSTPGTVEAHSGVVVRVAAPHTCGASAEATLTIGTQSSVFRVTTVPPCVGSIGDSDPDPFSYDQRTNVVPGSVVESNAITITGIDIPVSISIGNGEYSIDGGPWTSTPGAISNGQAVKVRQIASSSYNNVTMTILAVGTRNTEWRVFTAANISACGSACNSGGSSSNTTPTLYALSVNKGGEQTGTVTGASGSINCGSTCSATFIGGASITLTAVPDPGSVFAGWSGDCMGTGSCTVTMNAAKNVVATFSAVNRPPLAEFTLTPEHGAAPLAVNVNATSSSDLDGTIAQFMWSTSDGQHATGAQASFRFGAVGSYTVSLTVADNQGATATTSKVVTVQVPPSISVMPMMSVSASTGAFLGGDGKVFVTGRTVVGDQWINSSVPIELTNLRARSVAAGDGVGFAIDSGGDVWGWGDGSNGQLGLASCTNIYRSCVASTPVQVGLNDVVALAAEGGNSGVAAVKADGSVWLWGRGINKPTQLVGLTDMTSVSYGKAPVMLRRDGTVWVWENGVATQVPNLSGIKSIAAGFYHTLALKQDGTVWVWGSENSYGQLGLSSASSAVQPIQIPDLGKIKSISAGRFSSMALDKSGIVWVWGFVSQKLFHVTTPQQVSPLSDVVAIAAGEYMNNFALKSDGTIWGWGVGQYGLLANTGTSKTCGNADCVSTQPMPVLQDGGTALNLGVIATQADIGESVSAQASTSGNNDNLTLSISLNIDALLTGQNGNVYLAALLNDQWFVCNGASWALWTNGTLPPYFSGTLPRAMNLPVVAGADVRTLSGLKLFVGYGTTAEEMLQTGRVRLVHEIK